MTRLPSFSGLPRAFACRLSCVLPHVDEPTEYAQDGTARHRFFQRITELMTTPEPDGVCRLALEDAREAALAEAPEASRPLLAAINVDRIDLADAAAEVAVAFDIETGEARELGRGIERRYAEAAEAQGRPLRDTEVVGTLDRLSFVGSAGLRVSDFKGRSHSRRPSQDAQLLAGALAASRIYGRHEVELEVVKIIDGEGYSQEEAIDILELDTFETRLAELRARVRADRAAFEKGELPEAEVSDHCSFCPSFRYCPAQGAIARAVLGGDSEEMQAIVKAGQAYLSPEIAPRVHQLIGQAEKVLEVVKEAIREYARATPFKLADGSGRWYGVPPESKEREIVNGQAAAKVLAEVFGPDAAKVGTKIEVTLSGLEAAARSYLAALPASTEAKKPTLKATKEKAEALLIERGLLRTSYGGKVKIHKREAP